MKNKKDKVEKIVVGTLEFDLSVDLTDPCYKSDVWCRINEVDTVPGNWECVAWMSDQGKWGNRVAKLGVYLDGEVPETGWEHLEGEVGVDSGLAGVYVRKKNFTDDEWSEFCNMVNQGHAWVHHRNFGGYLTGFTTSSGYGDGGYPAFVVRNEEDDCIAIEIVFMEEEANP